VTTADRALYGKHTRLATENFGVRGARLGDVSELLSAYAHVKAAAALANLELGALDDARAHALVAAADEVVTGAHREQFPTPLVQGGGGTSTNMNINEVLAARAAELLAAAGQSGQVHPNDHANRSQSTNDTYPTAMALALLDLSAPALNRLEALAATLEAKAAEYGDLERLGRTCLQDAVPLTIRETHRAQAAAVRRTRGGLAAALEALSSVPLGATVIGTGVGAPDGFASVAVGHLAARTGRDLRVAADPFDALAHLDPYASVAAAAARAAIVLAKIAADLRLLSSGPRAGIGELELPARQPGSSIMPGKVNPVIPELVIQLSFRIRGAAHTVEMAVAAGELELNIMEPVILDALRAALIDLADAAAALGDKCVAEMSWNRETVREHLDGSRADLVTRATQVGYDAT
jgi:aspartate ammonia-lyase